MQDTDKAMGFFPVLSKKEAEDAGYMSLTRPYMLHHRDKERWRFG